MKVQIGQRFWITLTTVVFVFTVYIVGRNMINVIKIHRRIVAMEKEKRLYLQRIAEDSALIQRLQYDDYLEKYAREHYHMQRPDEHVYIIK